MELGEEMITWRNALSVLVAAHHCQGSQVTRQITHTSTIIRNKSVSVACCMARSTLNTGITCSEKKQRWAGRSPITVRVDLAELWEALGPPPLHILRRLGFWCQRVDHFQDDLRQAVGLSLDIAVEWPLLQYKSDAFSYRFPWTILEQ